MNGEEDPIIRITFLNRNGQVQCINFRIPIYHTMILYLTRNKAKLDKIIVIKFTTFPSKTDRNGVM